MRSFTTVPSVAVCTLVLSAVVSAYTAAAPLKQKIAVPSYWYPCHVPYNRTDPNAWEKCDWDVVNNSTPPVDVSIINPNSGPGESLDPLYAAQSQRSRTAGQSVLGYVHTSYGKRNMSTVLHEVDEYVAWYAVSGIFFDEASNDCGILDYYAELFAYVKRVVTNATVILNPGGDTQPCFLNVSDALATFEGDYASYMTHTPAAWELTVDASRIWHIVYSAAGDSVQNWNAVQRAKTLNAGWVYVTNLTLPNPYAALPGVLYLGDIVRWATNVF